jgi:hypothetical protein
MADEQARKSRKKVNANREVAMIKTVSALIIFITIVSTAGCEPQFRRPERPKEVAANRAEIIERLVPEGSSPRRLGAVIEAMTTVMDIEDKQRFPRNIRAVTQELQKANMQQLRRIERILPEVERRRQREGVD